MPIIESILGEIATEAAEGESIGCTDRATADELRDVEEKTTNQRRPFNVYDIQRKQELDHFMGRGPKPLDGSCRDHRDNGVLDD